MTRLLHLSDPHFGAVNRQVAERILQQAQELSPDVTVLSGDLTMRAHRRELDDAKAFVDALPRPLLMIPGNHDIPAMNNPLDRFFQPFRRYRKWFGHDLEPEQIESDLHLVSINSVRAFGLHADWSDGILSEAQLAKMVTQFKSGPPNLFRVLTLHHPLLASIGHGRAVVKPLPNLLRAIDEARVDLVLCGHFHRSQLATAGTLHGWKCIVSQAPTACSTRLHGEPQGFHLIQLSERKIEITPYQYIDGHFTSLPPLGFIRDDQGWKDCKNSHTDEIVSME